MVSFLGSKVKHIDMKNDQNKNDHPFSDATDKKVHQHLSDEKDVISEQDIENADIISTVEDAQRQAASQTPEESTDASSSVKDEKKDPDDKDENDDDKDDNGPVPITTPWNILGS